MIMEDESTDDVVESEADKSTDDDETDEKENWPDNDSDYHP